MGAIASAAYTAAMKGGEVQAAVRQGFNELGAALKAFHDAIQIDEPGAVFNPLYSDIAADNRAIAGAGLPTPAEIASGKVSSSMDPDLGMDNGRGRSM